MAHSRPSSRPAAASWKAPEQTESTRPPCARVVAQDVEDLGVIGAVDGATGDGDEVDAPGGLERKRRDDAHAARGAQHLAGTGRADPEVKGRDAVVGAVDAEDLTQDADLERRDGLLGDDGDGAQHLPSMTPVAGFCRTSTVLPLVAGSW